MKFLHKLQPQYDRAKSFYKKANVYGDNDGKIFLVSYSTIVAEIIDKIVSEDGKTHAKVYDWYSATTSRHINEFLQQHGFNRMSKKEMEKGGENQ